MDNIVNTIPVLLLSFLFGSFDPMPIKENNKDNMAKMEVINKKANAAAFSMMKKLSKARTKKTIPNVLKVSWLFSEMAFTFLQG